MADMHHRVYSHGCGKMSGAYLDDSRQGEQDMMRHMIGLLIAIGTLVVCTFPGDARDLTVRQNGQGDFQTIQACVDAAQAGDTCYISGSSHPYREDIAMKKSGRQGALIRLMAKPGNESVIIQSAKQGEINTGVVTITGDYVEIEGLTLANSPYGQGVLVRGSHNIVRNNTLVNMGRNALSPFHANGVIFCDGCKNSLIENNVLDSNYGHNIKLYRSHNNVVSHNTITNFRAKQVAWSKQDYTAAIWFGTESSHDIIENNTITTSIDVPGREVHYRGIWCDRGGSNTLVKGNTITDIGGRDGKGIFIESRCANNIVQGNTIANVTGDGLASAASRKTGFSQGTQWLNNAVYNTQGYGLKLTRTQNDIAQGNQFARNRRGPVWIGPEASGVVLNEDAQTVSTTPPQVLTAPLPDHSHDAPDDNLPRSLTPRSPQPKTD
jgi:parallel beta-helix repeat protein